MKKLLLFSFSLVISVFFEVSESRGVYPSGLPTCLDGVTCFEDESSLGDMVYETDGMTLYYKEGSKTQYGTLRYTNQEIYMQGSVVIATNGKITMKDSQLYIYAGTVLNPTTITPKNGGVLELTNTTIHLVVEETATDFNVDFSKIEEFSFIGDNDFPIANGDISTLPTIDLSEYALDVAMIGDTSFNPKNFVLQGWIRATNGINKLYFNDTGVLIYSNLNVVFDALTEDLTMPIKEGLIGLYFMNGSELDLTLNFVTANKFTLENFRVENESIVSIVDITGTINKNFSVKNIYVEDSSLTLEQAGGGLAVASGGRVEVAGVLQDSEFIVAGLAEFNGADFFMSGTKNVRVEFGSGVEFSGTGMNLSVDGSTSRDDYDFAIIPHEGTLTTYEFFSVSDANMFITGSDVVWSFNGSLDMQNTYMYVNDGAEINFSTSPDDIFSFAISGSYLHLNDATIDLQGQTLNLSNSRIYAELDSQLLLTSSTVIATNSDIILQGGVYLDIGELNMTGGTLETIDERVSITADSMSLDGTDIYFSDDLTFTVAGDVTLNNVSINKILTEETSTSQTSFKINFENLRLSGSLHLNVDIRTNDFTLLNEGKYAIFGYTNLSVSNDFEIIFDSSSILLDNKAYIDETVKAFIYEINGFVDLAEFEEKYGDGTTRRESTFNFLRNLGDMAQDGLGEEGTSVLINVLLSNSSDYAELDKSSHSLMANTSNSLILFNTSTIDKIEIFEKGINHFDYRASTDIMLSYSSAKDKYWQGDYLTAGVASLVSKSGSFKYGLGGYAASSTAEESKVWKEYVQSVAGSLFGYQIQNNYQFGFAITGIYSHVNGEKSDEVFRFMETEELAKYLDRSYEYNNVVVDLSFYYSIVNTPKSMPMAFKSTFQVSGIFSPSVFYQENGSTDVSSEVNTPDFRDVYISYTLTPVQILEAGKFIIKYNVGLKYHIMNKAEGAAAFMFSKGYNDAGYIYYYDDIAPFEAFFDFKLQTNSGLSIGVSVNKRGNYVNDYFYINYRIKGIGFY